MRIDIFCQVVDNYGDIAVVYRLAKDLARRRPGLKLRIFNDHPPTFSQLRPDFDPELLHQTVKLPQGSPVEFWDSRRLDEDLSWQNQVPDALIPAFSCEPPAVYMDWFNALPPGTLLRPRPLIFLEYLTAEAWSEELHLSPSPLGNPEISRHFFVPGFRPKAGGLILDPDFLELADTVAALAPAGRRQRRTAWAQRLNLTNLPDPERSWLTVFTYEHNFARLVADLSADGRPWTVFLPAGRSEAGFLTAWENRPPTADLRLVRLPFLGQEVWDELLLLSDLNLVRGEESLVRAVLSGQPFLWHAYLQPEGHQAVKVEAFLEVWQPFFTDPELFAGVARVFHAFNDRLVNSADEPARESLEIFLQRGPEIARVCRAFAADLRKNADLTAKLLDFLDGFLL